MLQITIWVILANLKEILDMAEIARLCGVVYRIRTSTWYLFIGAIHLDPFFNAKWLFFFAIVLKGGKFCTISCAKNCYAHKLELTSSEKKTILCFKIVLVRLIKIFISVIITDMFTQIKSPGRANWNLPPQQQLQPCTCLLLSLSCLGWVLVFKCKWDNPH